MSNEERKRRSTRTSKKPVKKLKGLEEVLSDEETSQDETLQKQMRKKNTFLHHSQPVLGTPLRKKLHTILANWKPPLKASQSTTKCNENEKDNMDSSFEEVGPVTITNRTEQQSHSTDTPQDLVTDDADLVRSDANKDQNSTSDAKCSLKSGREFSQNMTLLTLLGKDSNLIGDKEKKNVMESREVNLDDLKSKCSQNVPREKDRHLESKTVEKENLESEDCVKGNELAEVIVIDSPVKAKNEGEIKNIETQSMEYQITATSNDTAEEQLDEIKVSTPSPQQCQTNILASTGPDHSKLTYLCPKQCLQNIFDNTSAKPIDDPKLTPLSPQQFISKPSTCIPSFNDIVVLEQGECTQENESGRSFVKENTETKLTKEAQSGKGNLILNFVDPESQPVNTIKITDGNALYRTQHDMGEDVPNSLRNQQENELVLKDETLVDDDLYISDSQLESIERNFVPKLSTPSSVPSEQTNRLMLSSLTALSSSSSSFSNTSYNTPFTPKMNQMQWVSQLKNDKRRLQGIVREISQLNAMLTRAIKEIWPTKK